MGASLNWDFWLSLLTIVVIAIYAYYTYQIAKESNIPVSSISIKQRSGPHLDFYLRNFSKVEVESFVKIWANTEEGVFEFNKGPYGSKLPWIVEPFMELNGHFKLQDMVNKENEKLQKYIKSGKIKIIKFIVHTKYKKCGRRSKWIIPKPQRWIYNFDTGAFWLDIGFNPKP